MAMLAEPRRKQKWTLNPRGKQWSEDHNKFGQKMLEKMGWSSGKGLGANEQGMTEHVHVSFKDDTAGIGYKKDNLDKAWTEHQDSFNDFLKKLQTSESEEIVKTEEVKSDLSGKSLELKSKQSRARVHYHKFTRGKDVNKYSPKDIANIFGQKDLNVNNTTEVQNNEEESSDAVGTQYNKGGVITINGGNMADYFTKKGKDYSSLFKNKKRERSNSENEPEYAGFGFATATDKGQSQDNGESQPMETVCNYAFENPCLRLNSPENVSSSTSELKSSRKRKRSSSVNNIGLNNNSTQSEDDHVNENGHENGFVNPALNLQCTTDEVCNGQDFEVSRAEFGLANSALDLTDELNAKKRVTFNDHVEYSTDCTKRKKGKITLDKFEVENKKIKRKRKHEDSVGNCVSSGFVNEALDVEEASAEMTDNEINERKSRKSKKRKGSRRSNLETIVETPEEDKEICEDAVEIKRIKVKENTPDNSILEEVSNKKLKKKNKKKEKEREVVNENKIDVEKIVEEVAVIETVVEKEFERYNEEDQENITKRKKTNKSNIEPTIKKCEIKTDDNNTEDTIEEVVKPEEDITNIKKKKKSKKDKDANGLTKETIVNVKEEREISDKENANSIDESSPKVKKSKKKKHQTSVDESTKDSVHNVEDMKETVTEITSTPSKNVNNETFNFSSSPLSDKKTRMSKKLLKYLFHRNAVEKFPGSNIHEIKGYGTEIR